MYDSSLSDLVTSREGGQIRQDKLHSFRIDKCMDSGALKMNPKRAEIRIILRIIYFYKTKVIFAKDHFKKMHFPIVSL